MAVLSLDIALQLPAFRLRVEHVFAPAGLTAIFGPSGSGKSTLLRVIAGLEPGATGRVVFGSDTWQDHRGFVPPHRRGIGYVFQDARLFPHLSVAGNLAYAEKRARRAGRQPDRAQVVAALGLGGLMGRRTAGLSGGETQRVAMARALLSDPRLLLMDEPLAALDEASKAEILPCIERIRDEVGIPIVYVSHAVAEVARLADNVVMLRAGAITRSGAAAEILSDPDLAAALGVRAMGSVLSASVVAQHPDGLTELVSEGQTLFLPTIGAAVGAPLRVRIAAQDVILSRDRPQGLSALNILEGTLIELHMGRGPGVIAKLLVGREALLARITHRSAEALGLKVGMRCYAVAKSVSVAQADVGMLRAP